LNRTKLYENSVRRATHCTASLLTHHPTDLHANNTHPANFFFRSLSAIIENQIGTPAVQVRFLQVGDATTANKNEKSEEKKSVILNFH
jgi:hypothetical protein